MALPSGGDAGAAVVAQTSAASALWYDKIINDPVNLISIGLGIIGVVLGIIPLILYVGERRRAKLLDATIREFALYDRLRVMKDEAEKQTAASQLKLEEAKSQAKVLKEDIEERLPNAALVAYYQNTIPRVENQILDLGARLDAMRGSLSTIVGSQSHIDPKLQEVLSGVISENVGARRRLEQLQLVLLLCTGVTGAIVSILPFPFYKIAAYCSGLLVVFICFRLYLAARVAYPDNKILTLDLKKYRYRVAAGTIVITLLFWFIGALVYLSNKYD